ncbi:hypothetical protein BJ165DRAFT_1487426, partial [Panaeolus papilionaceus]
MAGLSAGNCPNVRTSCQSLDHRIHRLHRPPCFFPCEHVFCSTCHRRHRRHLIGQVYPLGCSAPRD